MPELPEVETIRRQLSEKIVGKKLQGKKISGLRRRAKILIIDFIDGTSLIFHLKLTGQLIFNGKPSRQTRKVFYFDDGSHLIFNDARKFGWWREIKNTKILEKQFGPEALEIGLSVFKDILKKHPKLKIKSLLMNQKIIAGIGNIYSDEILFAAKVAPTRQAGDISDTETRSIFLNIKKILKAAIKHKGSSVQYYLDACGEKGGFSKYHKVYGRQGQKCDKCKGVVKTIKINGRSAHFCPLCQK